MKHRKYIASFIGSIGFFITMPIQAADVVIGLPNWASVQATGYVLKVVLEDNLGLEVEIESSTNPVVFEAMDSGAMHIHPEVWLPNQNNLYNKFVKERGTVRANPNPVNAVQGICVTKGTAERTGITHLVELSDPDMAKKFDNDGDGKGEIWIGASGWASTNIEKVRAKSYGYDQTMYLKEIDEALAMEEVDTAVIKQENIVFFCYTPHQMVVQWDIVMLKEPVYDASKWNIIQPTDDPDWLEKSFAMTAWDQAYLHICYATRLESLQPAVVEILKKVKLDADILIDMSYVLAVQKRDPEEFAKQWVAENASRVDSWLQ